MAHDPLKGRAAFRLFTISCVFTVLGLMLLGFGTYRSYRLTTATIQRQGRLKDAIGTIIHLDEVLTMSARMGAVTGDPQWEARYRKFEPVLDAAIQEAVQLSPGTKSSDLAKQTDVANVKLVAMEHRSFEWTHQGQLAEAQALLFSDEYAVQKDVYAEGMHRLTDVLDEYVATILSSNRENTIRSVVLVLVVLSLLFLT